MLLLMNQKKAKKQELNLKKHSERINLLKANLKKPLEKSNDSTKTLKFHRLEDENKELRDENKKLRMKFKDEIKKLVDISKASGKTVNSDKNIIDKKNHRRNHENNG